MYSLIVDTSHHEHFIGILNEEAALVSHKRFSTPPYESLMSHLEALFNDSKVCLSEITRYYSPCAPGSTLGIRVARMAITGFQEANRGLKKQGDLPFIAPLIEYNGLYMTALYLKSQAASSNSLLITENGRDAWSLIDINKLHDAEILRVDSESLNSAQLDHEIYYIPQLKRWQEPPKKAIHLEYNPRNFLVLFDQLENSDINQNKLLTSDLKYKKWNA